MTQQKYIDIIMNQAATPKTVKPITKIINKKPENSSLFKVEQLGKTYIYKISDPQTSLRNLIMAQILLKNGVSVPDSKIFICGDQYFEKYEFNSGITLSAALSELDILPDTMEFILYETLKNDKKISEISVPNKDMAEQMVLYNRRKKHNTKDFGKILAAIHYIINKRQTTYGNVTLHHADLNPSNILLDSNLEFKSLLDLDGLALCDEYTVLSQILLSWPNLSVDKTVEIYESVFKQNLNKAHLKNMLYFRKMKSKTATVLRKVLQKHR